MLWDIWSYIRFFYLFLSLWMGWPQNTSLTLLNCISPPEPLGQLTRCYWTFLNPSKKLEEIKPLQLRLPLCGTHYCLLCRLQTASPLLKHYLKPTFSLWPLAEYSRFYWVFYLFYFSILFCFLLFLLLLLFVFVVSAYFTVKHFGRPLAVLNVLYK